MLVQEQIFFTKQLTLNVLHLLNSELNSAYLLGVEGKRAENGTKESAKCLSRTSARFEFCFLSQILRDPRLLFIMWNYR